MSAWVTREYSDANDLNSRGRPKRKREKVKDASMKGVQGGDRFVCEWYDPAGRRCREKIAGVGRPAKRLALDRCEQLNAQMSLGTYESKDRKTWDDFRKQYREKVLDGMLGSSRRVMEDALAHFEKIIKPKRMAGIDTKTVDDFIAERRKQRGLKPGSRISKASINKELRHLRAALRKAAKWGYLKKPVEFSFLREDDKLIRHISPDDFVKIYEACSTATLPAGRGYDPSDWWQTLLFIAYTTGWQIQEIITLRWEDVDLQSSKVRLRAENTKGKRHESIRLVPGAVEHLKRILTFHQDEVFGWFDARKQLWLQFHAIQKAAGIKLTCSVAGEHKCTDACGYYGFHDLRRGYASVNAPNLTADALQKLMRHKSYTTTQRYIAMASQLEQAVERIYVPELPKTKHA